MTKRFMVAAVFLAGCAVGGGAAQFAVPKASAQQAAALTRWQYLCPKGVDFDGWEAAANQAGMQGWELATLEYESGIAYPCFKRPKM